MVVALPVSALPTQVIDAHGGMARWCAQSDKTSLGVSETSGLEITLLRSLEGATAQTVQEAAALRSVVRLLGEAGRALSVNRDNARKLIVRAAAVLQAELDSRNHIAAGTVRVTGCRLAPWQVTRVTRFIEANLSEKVGPQDLASLARLSTSHFARAFRATVGKSPYAYLIHRRIERTKEMMLETDLPLVQIALDCGLADQAHFTRLFTRIVGISPAAWRRLRVPKSTISGKSQQTHAWSRTPANLGHRHQRSVPLDA
jgi:AraC-like DNA-binding protein